MAAWCICYLNGFRLDVKPHTWKPWFLDLLTSERCPPLFIWLKWKKCPLLILTYHWLEDVNFRNVTRWTKWCSALNSALNSALKHYTSIVLSGHIVICLISLFFGGRHTMVVPQILPDSITVSVLHLKKLRLR